MKVIGKGQSEVVTFILLFLVGLALFMASIAWSSGLFQQNVDIGRVATAENFIFELVTPAFWGSSLMETSCLHIITKNIAFSFAKSI